MNFKNLAYCLIVVLIVPQIYSQQVDNKKNENINIDNQLTDENQSNKTILIFSLGEITFKELKIVNENLFLKGKQILGWILI